MYYGAYSVYAGTTPLVVAPVPLKSPTTKSCQPRASLFVTACSLSSSSSNLSPPPLPGRLRRYLFYTAASGLVTTESPTRRQTNPDSDPRTSYPQRLSHSAIRGALPRRLPARTGLPREISSSSFSGSSASPHAMDFAQTLLKMVTRAFYDTRQIIAVDAVMTHSWFVSRCL